MYMLQEKLHVCELSPCKISKLKKIQETKVVGSFRSVIKIGGGVNNSDQSKIV